MKNVKILSGGYGVRTKSGVKLAYQGEVIAVDDVEAVRLARIGAAVMENEEVTAQEIQSGPPDTPAGAPGTSGTADAKTAEITEAGLKRLTKPELLAIAAQKGLDATEDMTKNKIIDLILAEEGGEPEGGNDNEPPVTTPAQPE